MTKSGTLYLVPIYISEDHPDVLPASVLGIIHTLDEFVVENEKTARRFLKLAGTPVQQSKLKFKLLNEHTSINEIPELLEPLLHGRNIGLMSEAGCPGVADPGAELVRLAHSQGIHVKPLIGPSSILLALMGSGMNGQLFTFHGYLPREAGNLKQKIRELENEMLRKNQTQVFIEVPYRNDKIFQELMTVCNPDTRLCIACELTGMNEFIQTRSIRDWKKNIPVIQKRTCVFLLGK